ncbi:MAG TPA: YHYH protein [Ilumatobacteraceae bacterium]|nr:YHYH protein [Ilumatobacteraceae bacterium]
MFKHIVRPTLPTARFVALACGALLAISACASSDAGGTDDVDVAGTSEPAGTVSDNTETTTVVDSTSPDTTAGTAADAEAALSDGAGASCDDVAALFVTRGSANADLDDPEVNATCDGNDIVVTSNGIPDYTYIETSPGQPRDQDNTFTIPATPTIADTVTDIPLLGTAAVSLGGIQIFGPTEGTGGDVESLPGILSDCGSHNGPSGFHIHLILTSSDTDCLFTPEEVAAEPQLVGYAFDGFPIYTGIDQYTSSWQLTDESLFATDTWAAHSYVEGSGDLDQCNGRTDADGNYAYYTTATFPYILGCYTGVVDLDAPGGGGGGGDGERPERPEGDDAEGERPERPEGDDAEGARPERPERPEGDDAEGARPERPEGAPPEGGAGGGGADE